jgi:hypothetical protein
MSYEFDLVPPDAAGFSPETLAHMREWWDRFVVTDAGGGTLLVFPDEEIRDIRLARRRAHPERNDNMTAYVSFASHRVEISVTGDGDTSEWLRDFVIDAENRWSARLQYFGRPASPDDLVEDDED